jgi:hypothetical protein
MADFIFTQANNLPFSVIPVSQVSPPPLPPHQNSWKCSISYDSTTYKHCKTIPLAVFVQLKATAIFRFLI